MSEGLFSKFTDMSIRWKLLLICVILVSVPVLSLSYFSYSAAQTEIDKTIESNLKLQAGDYEQLTKSYQTEITDNKKAADTQARDMSAAYAKTLYAMVSNTFQGVDPANDTDAKEKLLNKLSTLTVGKTGYVYILDYDGNYVLSKGRATDGKNIIESKDDSGNLFIQEIISKGRALSADNVAYEVYPWKNAGDTVARDKIAAFVNYPDKRWIIAAGAYVDDLVDTGFESRKKEELKNIIAKPVIGDTGYIWVFSTADTDKGTYVVSQKRTTDGKSMWDSKDEKGNLFIQEIINKGKNLQSGASACSRYTLGGKEKIACYVYIPEWNWLIGPSSYIEEFQGALTAIYNTTIVVAIAAIIIGSAIAYVFANMIAKPLGHVTRIVERVSKGDLTEKVNMANASKDEIGQMSIAFDRMIDDLREIVSQIVVSSTEMSSSSEELSASAEEVNASNEQVTSTVQQIAKGAQEQSRSLENTSKTVGIVSGNSNDVARASTDAAQAAKKAGESAKKGQELGSKATGKMGELATAINQSAEEVKGLDTKGQQIGKIVDTITSIADQTNLLALNAAIEAARAGDAGRGFAVVADEVRKLAEESSTAAGQIEGIIKDMVESTKGTSQSMNTGVKSLDEANVVVNGALAELQAIAEIAKQVQQQSEAVSVKAQEASAGTAQIADNVKALSATAEENAAASEEVSASTEETAASMNQVASAAQSIASMSQSLSELVSRFKLPDDMKTTTKAVAKQATIARKPAATVKKGG